MRIAQVAPLTESVPPQGYGGTERVVYHLTEELIGLGHEVTLYASGDSRSRARLRPMVPRALRQAGDSEDPLARHLVMLEQVFREIDRYDLVHFHVDYLHFPFSRRAGEAQLTTLHGRLDIPDLPALFAEYAEMPLVSISNSQRAPMPAANWLATVYHGLSLGRYRLHEQGRGYLAFLGRISPEKGLDQAMEIARRLARPLRVAAKLDQVDRAYFEACVRPLLPASTAEFIGEIGDADKNDFLGGADALLMPIDWEEPFGLVMIEAMACGTPVIAYRRGSVPEIVAPGVSGYIVDGVEEACAAVARVSELDRRRCRAYFEQRFSSRRMASEYLDCYAHLLERRRPDALAGGS